MSVRLVKRHGVLLREGVKNAGVSYEEEEGCSEEDFPLNLHCLWKSDPVVVVLVEVELSDRRLGVIGFIDLECPSLHKMIFPLGLMYFSIRDEAVD